MTGATGIIYTGRHELPDIMIVCHLLRENGIFVDVGANIGGYSVLASGIVQAETIAFEPDPETANFFRRNIEVNHFDELVQLHELADGNCQKIVKFTVGRDTMNQVAKQNHGQTPETRQTTLNDIVAD